MFAVSFACTGLITLVFPWWLVSLQIDSSEPLEPSSSSLSFVTFSKMTRNRDYEKLMQLVDCEKYDIIAIQEVGKFRDKISEGGHPNCFFHMSPQGGLALFSKYPIKFVANHKFAAEFNVDFDGQAVIVITLRLDRSLKSALYQKQLRQLTKLGQVLENIDSPLVVAGDFNSTPHNYSIWYLSQRLDYSKPEGLFGARSTFPGEARKVGALGALIQIDHIFTRELGSRNTRVLSESFGSDHLPVYTELFFTHSVSNLQEVNYGD